MKNCCSLLKEWSVFFNMWPFWVVSHASNFSAGQIPFPRHLVWGCFNAGRDSVSKSSTSARANAEGERRASVLLKNSSSVLWQKRVGFLWQGDVRGWDVIADQAQGEIEVFQFQVYSDWVFSIFSLINDQYQNWKFETRRKGRSRQHFENYWIFHPWWTLSCLSIRANIKQICLDFSLAGLG